MHIFLFDIDGTLIHTGGAGGDAILDALREDFAPASIVDGIAFAGRTDRAICRDLLRINGLPVNEENWQKMRTGYLRRLGEYLPQRQGAVLPGIHESIARLSKRKDVALGLLTGNTREGARLKLGHYGLFDHFAFGGFGDHHDDRNLVAAEALAAARAHLPQHDLSLDRVYVIGDTPLDVSCARSIGAVAIAVATGGHSRAELATAKPDHLFEDLTDVAWAQMW